MDQKKYAQILQEYNDIKDLKCINKNSLNTKIVYFPLKRITHKPKNSKTLLMKIEKKMKTNNLLKKKQRKLKRIFHRLQRTIINNQLLVILNLKLDDEKLEPDWLAINNFLAVDIDDKKSGWKKVQGSPTRKYATKKLSHDPVFSVKSEFTMFDKNIHNLFNLLADCKLQMTWDKHFESVEVIEKMNQYSDIVYLRVKRLFKIVSPRDMIMYRFITNNQDNIEVFDRLDLRSIDRPKYPPQKGYIRANVPIILTIMEESEEDPSKIKVVIVNNTDIKGNFPKFLFNLFAPDMVGRMKLKLNQAYDNIYGKQKK